MRATLTTILTFVIIVKFVAIADPVKVVEVNKTPNSPKAFQNRKFLDNPISYRLPNDSIPIRYDLWLKTDVHEGEFEFSGRVKIQIKILEQTQQITLHHRQLKILNIDLLSGDESLMQSNLTHVYHNVFELLTVGLPSLLSVDEEIVLDISYVGTLGDYSFGFFHASYQKDDETVWFASTQFEMANARYALPCYDEPGLRAIFGIEIEHHKSYNATSNMPIVSREPASSTDYVTSKFEDTPAMPAYLLAFLISDFTSISNNLDVEQKILARPQAIDSGRLDFALSVVDPILRGLEEHFGLVYPLSKVDHVAITDFIFSSMEGYGLITYIEWSIAYDATWGSKLEEQEIIRRITSELVHQWFVLVVNPKWWSFAWLNEGFAALYEYYVPSILYPEFDFMDSFLQSAEATIFYLDVGASKPMNFYIEKPDDIRLKFDAITSQKAGCVLRMFQEALSVPTFTKGLTFYLKKMQFSPASPQDLHESLQEAYDEDFPGNSLDINQTMSTWENQAGYPIILVEKTDNKVIFTQSRFGGGREIYSVPIAYVSKSAPNFDRKTAQLWLTTASTEIDFPADDWMIVNVHSTGYYKVSYDKNSWAAIALGLQQAHEEIPKHSKIHLFKDVTPLLLDSSVNAVDVIRMLSFLGEEKDYRVWVQIYDMEMLLSRHLFGTSVYPKYQQFFREILRPHADRLGFEPIVEELTEDFNFINYLTTLSCKNDDVECLNHEFMRLENFITTGDGRYDFRNGIKAASEEFHAFLVREVLAGRNRDYVYFLGGSLDENILRNFLPLMLNTSNRLNSDHRRGVIQNTMGTSVQALDITLDFISEHLEDIERM